MLESIKKNKKMNHSFHLQMITQM